MKYTDPQEVQRRVVLALTLEPLAEKKGCTTRSHDLAADKKLVDFQAAAISSGPYFNILANRINKTGKQPKVFYDLCLAALVNSTKNLDNKKHLNWGLLDLMFPLVVSHLAYGGQGTAICKNVVKVLKASSHRDVIYKSKCRKEAWRTSGKLLKRNYPINDSSNNLYEDYRRNIQISEEIGYDTNVFWLSQLSKGLPVVQKMYQIAHRKVPRMGLLKSLESSFKEGMRYIDRVGVVADYTAAVAYLLLIDPKSGNWVK